MSVVEFIGFSVSLVCVLFLFFKNKQERQVDFPEDVEEEEFEESPLKQFLVASKEHREPVRRVPLPPVNEPSPRGKGPNRREQESYTKVPSPSQSPSPQRQKVEWQHESSVIRQEKIRRDQNPLKHRTVGRPLTLPSLHSIDQEGRASDPSRAQKIIKQLPQLRSIIIYQAILDKPKGWDNF